MRKLKEELLTKLILFTVLFVYVVQVDTDGNKDNTWFAHTGNHTNNTQTH